MFSKHNLLLQLYIIALLSMSLAQHLNSSIAEIQQNLLSFSNDLEKNWLSTDYTTCDDFYGYVCSKVAQDGRKQSEEQLNKLISSEPKKNNATLGQAELQMLHFHTACLQPRSLSDLKSILTYRYSGGWPAVEETGAPVFTRKKPTWMHTLIAFHRFAKQPYFFKHHIEMKSNRRYVNLLPSDTQLYSLSEYEIHLRNVLKTYNVTDDKTALIATDALKFERLRRFIFAGNITEERAWNYTAFKEQAFPGLEINLDWDYYFKKVLGKAPRPNDVIVVHDFKKMELIFSNILQSHTMTHLLNWIWSDYLMDKDSANCQKITKKYFKPVYEHLVQRSVIHAEEMIQMYADLKSISLQERFITDYLDETLQQNFITQVNWWTSQSAAKLNNIYSNININRKKFFRNLDKVHSFIENYSTQLESYHHAINLTEYFMTINSLLVAPNLTVPLNYMLVAQHYTEEMLYNGIPRQTEQNFEKLRNISNYILNENRTNSNSINIVLTELSYEIGLTALRNWMQDNVELTKSLEQVLSAGSIDLTLEKLYFIGSLLGGCQSGSMRVDKKDFVNKYLRNSNGFLNTFNCKKMNKMYIL